MTSSRKVSSLWPGHNYWEVPGTQEAVSLAQSVRGLVAGPDERLDLRKLSRLGGFRVNRKMKTESISLEGLMVNTQNGIAILIYLHPWERERANDPNSALNHFMRFVWGHEIGHSFFYNRDSGQPNRTMKYKWGYSPEERFCDIFGVALLLPHPIPSGSNIALSKRFGVPLKAVEWAKARFDGDSRVIKRPKTIKRRHHGI